MRVKQLILLTLIIAEASWSSTVFAVNEAEGYHYVDGVSTLPPTAATQSALSTYVNHQDNLYLWDMQSAAGAVLKPDLIPTIHISSTYDERTIRNQSYGDSVTSAVISDNLRLLNGPGDGSLQFFVSERTAISVSAGPRTSVAIVSAYGAVPAFGPAFSTQYLKNTYFNFFATNQIYSHEVLSDSEMAELSFVIPFSNNLASYSLVLRSFTGCFSSSSCSSAVDSTVLLTGVRILNAAGNPYTGAFLASDSGLNYSALPDVFVDPWRFQNPT